MSAGMFAAVSINTSRNMARASIEYLLLRIPMMTVEQTAKRFSMSTEEVKERVEEGSFFGGIIGSGHIGFKLMIPEFQFNGEYHIPNFHEVWDEVRKNCDNERVMEFFTHTESNKEKSIAQIMKGGVAGDDLQRILDLAKAFR